LTLEQVSINLLRTRHAHLRLNRSRVGVSTIPNAGVGVFATRFIHIGELITLYPGDALLQWRNATDYEDRHGVALRVLLGPHLSEMERHEASTMGTLFGRSMDAARAYEVRIADTISVVGDPQRCHDAAYLGHLLNDGACCLSNTSSTKEAVVTAYAQQSLAAANAKIVVGTEACHVEVVAMKPIAPGQEIFLSYGASYWLSRLLPKQQSPSKSSLGFASPLPQNSKRKKR
jgi:SET domain